MNESHLEIIVCDGWLLARASGRYGQGGTREHLAAICRECSRRGCWRVLYDTRAFDGQVPIIDRYVLGAHFSAIADPRMRVALLDCEERITPQRFLEDVTRNRGLMMGIFTDFDQALAWLGMKPAPSE